MASGSLKAHASSFSLISFPLPSPHGASRFSRSFYVYPPTLVRYAHPRLSPALPAVSPANQAVTAEPPPEPPVKMVSVVGAGAVSPLNSASWEEVMLHTAKILKWVDEGYELLVFTNESIRSNSNGDLTMRLKKELP